MALTKMLIFYAAGVPCFGMVDLIADYNLVKTDGVCGMKLKWERQNRLTSICGSIRHSFY
jgi:hypothetical protein